MTYQQAANPLHNALKATAWGRFALVSSLVAALILTAHVLVSAQSVSLSTPLMTEPDSLASIKYEENAPCEQQLHVPIYHWWQAGTTPRGAVVAVHGLIMHGRSFDTLGRALASQGFDVYATDMRGYGRCMSEDHVYCSESDCKHKIDYDKSYDDLKEVAHYLREKYPSTPIFAVGESLGGTMIIRLASKHPELVDGLILSAPAIKRHSFVDPCLLANTGLVMVNPRTQLDVMPFVRKYASDDPRVIAEKETDPLMRRHLSAFELLQSSLAVRKTVTYIAGIPAATPVLVIQGSADRCIQAKSVMLLLDNLRSNDQTVKWFHERGHILLETAYVKPDTMDAVVNWLNKHADGTTLHATADQASTVAALHKPPLYTSSNAGPWALVSSPTHN